MAVAGALEIQLFAGIARLQKDMNDAKRVVGNSMKSIDSAVGMAKKALGALGISIGVISFVRIVQGALDAQDALSKLSQKLNVDVSTLAGYQHAADLAGVSNEALTKAFKTLASQMFDASSGLLESKRNFAALGVEVKKTDGTLKDTDAVMMEVADRFAKMQDGAAKSALAVKLFGKAGLDMIPMLNEGSAAIAAMVEEGKRLNPVTAESAKQAEIFNDNLSRVAKSAAATGIALLNKLLPAMAAISKEMAKAATMPGGGFWAALLAGAQTALTGDDALKNLQERARLAQQMAAAQQAIEINTASFGEEDRRTIAAKASLDVLRARMTTSMEYYKQLQLVAKAEAEAEARAKAGKKGSPGIVDEDAAKKAAQAAAKEYDWLMKHLQDGEDEWQKTYTEAWQAYEEFVKLTTKNVAADNATMWQQVFAEIDAEQDRLIEEGAILLAHTEDVTDEMTEFWKSAAQSMQSSMSDFFFDVMQGNLTDLGKSFKRTIDRMISDMIAAQAAMALFGKNFGKGDGQLGGLLGQAINFIGGKFGGTQSPAPVVNLSFGGAQAKGGDYMVTKPTLFLAGEAGPERARFSGANNAGGGGDIQITQNMTFGSDVNRATLLQWGEVVKQNTVAAVRESQARAPGSWGR